MTDIDNYAIESTVGLYQVGEEVVARSGFGGKERTGFIHEEDESESAREGRMAWQKDERLSA
jgi:hypothetical protein